jgi:hypothetical protein
MRLLLLLAVILFGLFQYGMSAGWFSLETAQQVLAR